MSRHKIQIAETIIETVNEGGEVDEVLELIEQANNEPDGGDQNLPLEARLEALRDPIPGFATTKDYVDWLKEQDDEYWERQSDYPF